MHTNGPAALVASHFFRRFTQRFGVLPRSYLCIDTETTGVDTHSDLIVQLGHCLVLHGEAAPEHNAETLLDWTREPGVDQVWLRDRLARVKAQVESKPGAIYPYTYSLLAERGQPPREVLQDYLALLDDTRAAGYPLVAHNGWKFDVALLRNHFKRWLGQDWDLGLDEMFDTGAICKASQGGLYPDSTDSIKSFSLRVAEVRLKGVFWNLTAAMERYGLFVKYGMDKAKMHGAAQDCLCCHYLLEHYRELTAALQV